jgi:hypothetical protein
MSLGTAITIKTGYQARGTILGKFLSAACIGVLLGLFVTSGRTRKRLWGHSGTNISMTDSTG